MPKRTDISSILIIGAGPIVIGQACEFDYSGTQACKALREEGYRIILVNSNPATIMTDPDLADATYIEPITPELVAKIIEKERPDALLPTMGGQTALNCALDLEQMGVLEKYGVEMIGARAEVIDKAEDREKFRAAMDVIGLENPRAAIASSPAIRDEDGRSPATTGTPVIWRPCALWMKLACQPLSGPPLRSAAQAAVLPITVKNMRPSCARASTRLRLARS
jgi:carbamoyl-phosphate synthase large subunit